MNGGLLAMIIASAALVLSVVTLWLQQREFSHWREDRRAHDAREQKSRHRNGRILMNAVVRLALCEQRLSLPEQDIPAEQGEEGDD